ncbi:MAG: putative FAD-linked oxidoreductase [Syntrophomonadaceae bacterium]|nr:putative FAD-linked oxidoreductase [Bacillota bacterium]
MFSKKDLLAYSFDATSRQEMPEVIVFPLSTAEVSAVMKVAHRERIPVVPRGAGTNLSGGTMAVRGGVILELSRMNRILEVDTVNRRAVVGPGVVNLDLQNALAPLRFIYPPDPASQRSSTLGGNIGENAGGPRCLRYGVTSKYVCGMEVVLANGEIVDTGGSVEDIPGYDLRGLLIGSEGTLGIATKLVLHIAPMPEAYRTLLAIFETVDDASQAVSDIISIGIIPGALELMDKTICQVIEQGIHAGYPVDAEGVLLIELEGLADSLDRQVKDISVICQRNKVRELRLAQTSAERDAIWKGRRGAFGAVARISPNYLVNDGTVPRNKLVEALRKVREIAEKYHLIIANVAHAGDGNLHPLIMFDANNPDESAAARKAGEEILDVCLALDGTISGEHGIGLEKLHAMHRIFSPTDLATMRKVKLVFDPDDILNPGKLLPPEVDKFLPARGESIPVEQQALYQRLAQIVAPENVMTDKQVAAPYEVDGLVPIGVVFVSTTEQVSQIIKAGNQFRTPIIPWGGGSKQQVGSCLSAADIILCLKHMKQIVDLDVSNLTVKVEAGMVNSELQRQLVEHRLFFPLDPLFMETSTIGGELAANASGLRRVMYGTARDLVLGVTVVTPSGGIIHAGGKTMKNVAGIDLCKMFIGSWGTLGIITEAVLRLFPLPEVSKSLWLTFSNFEDALRSVTQLLNSTLSPSSVELIDWVAGRNLGYSYGSPLEEGEVLLMVNIEGGSEAVDRHLKEISTIAEVNKARYIVTIEGEEATRAWDAYRGVHQSLLSAVPSPLQGKACVPISKLGDMFKAVKEVGNRYSVEIGITAHCGNGILYPYVVTGNADAVQVIGDLRQAVVGLGGCFIVEAGPLWVRKKVDVLPHRNDYTLMKRLKTQLDPNNILNPGRVVGGLY